MGCIYCAINTITHKKYIGKTIKSLSIRKSHHISLANGNSTDYFHRSIRKYGPAAFIWELIFESNDPNQLTRMEIKLIRELNTKIPLGYNLTDGGEGLLNPSEETRNKIRNKQLGHIMPDKVKAVLYSKETRKKAWKTRKLLDGHNIGRSAYFIKSANKWKATLWYDGRRIYLGCYISEEFANERINQELEEIKNDCIIVQ